MITEMNNKGFRAYHIKTSFYKRYIDQIQKRLDVEIIIGGDNLLFIKTNKKNGTPRTNKFL